MKIFTNLPASLRVLFGFLRLTAILLAVFWLLLVAFGPWLTNRFQSNPNLTISMGEVTLQPNQGALELKSDSAKSGALVLSSLRGTLQMDIGSKDARLVSAVRLTLFPAIMVFAACSWVLFGSLRSVCANIESGEVFSEKNLRLVRRIGATIIAYSLIGGLVWIWSSYVISAYLSQHVVVTGIQNGLQFPAGARALFFNLSPALFSTPGGLITGCLVLVVAEAFRQGLNLKTENDLTV